MGFIPLPGCSIKPYPLRNPWGGGELLEGTFLPDSHVPGKVLPSTENICGCYPQE